jgi:hypothetical protein
VVATQLIEKRTLMRQVNYMIEVSERTNASAVLSTKGINQHLKSSSLKYEGYKALNLNSLFYYVVYKCDFLLFRDDPTKWRIND